MSIFGALNFRQDEELQFSTNINFLSPIDLMFNIKMFLCQSADTINFFIKTALLITVFVIRHILTIILLYAFHYNYRKKALAVKPRKYFCKIWLKSRSQ